MGTPRAQAVRDAATVEIAYALLSAAVTAALVLGTVAGPTVLFTLPGPAATGLRVTGLALAAVVFFARVWFVLRRFHRTVDSEAYDRHSRLDGVRDRAPYHRHGQPSQPGRTNPDS
ncbi:DUF6332 family protein [Streptomyces sp. NPDC002851]